MPRIRRQFLFPSIVAGLIALAYFKVGPALVLLTIIGIPWSILGPSFTSACICETNNYIIAGTAALILAQWTTIGADLDRKRERRNRARGHICLRCGYDLRLLPERRCPECGTTF